MEPTRSTTINYVCLDSLGKIKKRIGYQIGDIPDILTEMMAITKSIRMAIQIGSPQVILESDSQIAINAITGRIKTPKLIGNLVRDIKYLATCLSNFQFVFVTETKDLADRIVKGVHHCNLLVLMIILSEDFRKKKRNCSTRINMKHQIFMLEQRQFLQNRINLDITALIN